MAINNYCIVTIDGYFVGGYSIGGYSINGYWRLFY